MSYLPDPDLAFLKYLPSEAFEGLVDCLVYDKDRSRRFTETLSDSEQYKINGNAYCKYWNRIAEELQRFGGNTLANTFRGNGVLYRELLCDLCTRMKVKFNKEATTETIEMALMMRLVEDYLEQLDQDQIRELSDELGLGLKTYTKQAAFIAFRTIIKSSGFKAYILIGRIVNSILKLLIGRGLAPYIQKELMRSIKIFTGPIGIAVMSAWTIYDISGPAYRVTLPAVLNVIMMRQAFIEEHGREKAERLLMHDVELSKTLKVKSIFSFFS